jgi:hypothetical protein
MTPILDRSFEIGSLKRFATVAIQPTANQIVNQVRNEVEFDQHN